MNEAFERSSRVSSLTCIFHVLFPGAAESLRHLGWEPVVKPGSGSSLPILNGQWQLQRREPQQWGVACKETWWEGREPSLKVAKYSNHGAGKLWAGPGRRGRKVLGCWVLKPSVLTEVQALSTEFVTHG